MAAQLNAAAGEKMDSISSEDLEEEVEEQPSSDSPREALR